MDDLPKEFDLIVVGTGLTESIVAAAASRIGKTVLHLDRNDYYGGYWASFNLEALQSYAKQKTDPESGPSVIYDHNGVLIHYSNCRIENVDMKWLIPEAAEDDYDSWTVAKCHKEMRRFNIDLHPTLLYSLGSMVKLLISSNICRYAEFRAVDRVATLLERQIKTVPCSRSDVFVSNEVNIVEKRIMMKTLEQCMNYKEGKEGDESLDQFKEKTFDQFLQAKRVPAKVRHYLLNALSMSTEETSFDVGVERLNKFVESLGRYGNTPFLYPMYGCGEIPQCFCRLCAVFGGIYCLQRGIQRINVLEGDELEVELDAGDDKIKAKDVLFGAGTINAKSNEPSRHLVRCIMIVDQPLEDAVSKQLKGGGVEFLRLRSAEASEAFLIQLSHYSGCCPKDVFLYHVLTEAKTDANPRDALKPFLDQIFIKAGDDGNQTSPKILFEMYFTIPIVNHQFKVSKGIHLAGSPTFQLDYDDAINGARQLFGQLYPEEEFLPRAPEPEEIIIEGYEETKTDAGETELSAPVGDAGETTTTTAEEQQKTEI